MIKGDQKNKKWDDEAKEKELRLRLAETRLARVVQRQEMRREWSSTSIRVIAR